MKYIGLFDEKEDIVTKEKLDAKQDKITVSGILKGDGAGGVSAAVANTDYATCTNLRNGDTEGSLRTLNSQPPDDAYTMGANAFAEGVGTRATRTASHAEGFKTGATGIYSHAEGREAEAYGAASHAEGAVTIASHRAQHVQGEYNVEDGSTASPSKRGNYAHIVGNGTSIDARSNAHTLDWSGNAWFAGDVYVGSTSGTNKDEGSKKLITADEVAGAINLDSLKEVYFGANGSLSTGDIEVIDEVAFKELTYQLQQLLLDVGGHTFVEVLRPCLRAQLNGDNFTTVILKYSGVGASESRSVFNGICFDHANQIQYSVSLYYNLNDGNVEQVLLTEISNGALPTVTTSDNGKFLRVVNGAWAAATVDNANGGAF